MGQLAPCVVFFLEMQRQECLNYSRKNIGLYSIDTKVLRVVQSIFNSLFQGGNLMKFLANQKLATRISIITTAITFAGLLLLWFIVANRVASAEEYVTAFALSSEVQDLLANPEDPALLQKGQKYTEDFAAVKGIFEGLYISTPDTYVLTHTSQGAIGITTQEGDSLTEFQNTILAQPQLTNLGIMESPGTGILLSKHRGIDRPVTG